MKTLHLDKWMLWVALGAVLALAVWLGVGLLPPVAQAQGTYTMVLLDGDAPIEAQVDGNHYTVVYRNGLHLTARLYDNEGPIEGQNLSCEYGDVWTDTGTYAITITANVQGAYVMANYVVDVTPAVLTVGWDNDTLQSQYGQPVSIGATLRLDGYTMSWQALQADDPTASLSYEAGTGAAFDRDYLMQYGVLGTAGGQGKNTVTMVLSARNYVLDANTATALYNLIPYQGSLAIGADSVEQQAAYTGRGIDLVDLYRVSVVDAVTPLDHAAYTVVADVTDLADSSVQKDVQRVTSIGSYSVTFHFAGSAANFDHYANDTVCTLTVTPCQTRVQLTNDTLVTVPYNPSRAANSGADNKAILDVDVLARMPMDFAVVDVNTGVSLTLDAALFACTYSTTRTGFDQPGYDATQCPDPDYISDGDTWFVCVAFAGNAEYAPSQGVLPMRVVSRDLSDAVRFTYAGTNTLAARRYSYLATPLQDYVYYGFNEEDSAVQAYLNYRKTNAYTETLIYQRWDGENWIDDTPAMPATYRALLTVVSRHYRVDYASDSFSIAKVTLGQQDLVVAHPAIAYGDVVDMGVTVGAAMLAAYGMDATATWTYTVDSTAAVLPVGTYDVRLDLDHPLYECTGLVLPNGLTITPRSVEVRVWDRDVDYGDPWYPNGYTYGTQDAGSVWWAEGAVLADDVEDVLAGLTIYVVFNDLRYEYGTVVLPVNTAGYPLEVEARQGNYNLVSAAQTGYLHLYARRLNITIDGKDSIYEGGKPQLSPKLGNVAEDDDADALLAALHLTYTNADGDLFEGEDIAFDVGRYTVGVAVDNEMLFTNYKLSVTPFVLTVIGKQIETGNADVVVSGWFRAGASISVTATANSTYNAAINKAVDGYSVYMVYEIDQPVDTMTGNVTITLPCPATGKVAVVYLDGNQWKTVEFTRVADQVTFSQRHMATAYAVVTRREANWLLIGLIIGGVALAGVAVLVVLLLRRKQRGAVLAQQATESQMAPTASANPNNEEDELDEYIEHFDASSVEQELTPAERIALREREERYAQYRARLARLRGSDRTMTETLAQLGLDSTANDEEIIERMIAEDEERARRLQEELDREAEERRRAEEAPTMVILDHSDEVLEQQTVVPTMRDDDDIDDIDI